MCVCVCVHRCVHSCTCSICENSVRNKNPIAKSQQVVQAQSVCVCVGGGGCTGYLHNNARCIVTHVRAL